MYKKSWYSQYEPWSAPYVGRGTSVLPVTGLNPQQVVILSTWMVVRQQGNFPLRVQQESIFSAWKYEWWVTLTVSTLNPFFSYVP